MRPGNTVGRHQSMPWRTAGAAMWLSELVLQRSPRFFQSIDVVERHSMWPVATSTSAMSQPPSSASNPDAVALGVGGRTRPRRARFLILARFASVRSGGGSHADLLALSSGCWMGCSSAPSRSCILSGQGATTMIGMDGACACCAQTIARRSSESCVLPTSLICERYAP
jgi:hypothetical protein